MRRLAFLVVLMAGCGGGGGADDIATGDRSCGLDAYLPNYAAAEDGFEDLVRWDRSVVTYRIETAGASEAEIRAVEDGFAVWENVDFPQTNNRFQLVRTEGPADIVVLFRTLNQLAGAAGTTRGSYTDDGFLVSAEVTLGLTEGSYDLADAENTAQHEMGHALGIFKHSPNPEDLMFFQGNTTGIQLRDENTLRTGYCGALADGRTRGRKVATRTITIRD